MYDEIRSFLESCSGALKEHVHGKLDELTVELEARVNWLAKRTAASMRAYLLPVVLEALFVGAGVIIFTVGAAQFLESILPLRGSGTMLAGAALMLIGVVYAKNQSHKKNGGVS
ncbi:MAG: hypothetical protein HY392_04735 [Candidatus Diapherotrites archaeon]|nr:hypothetical protein [Candidatus Diapherotrites archaeon]